MTRLVAAAVVALALPLVHAGQAGASAWPNDTWDLTDREFYATSIGGVVWGNRTATLQGSLEDLGGIYGATVHFTAYDGATRVTGTTRHADPDEVLPFNFSFGDPDRVGGFDRLKIQVCADNDATTCSPAINLNRDGTAEKKVWYPS